MTLALLALVGGIAAADPQVLNVMPEGGPWFERIQARADDEPTAQLLFEVDFVNPNEPFKIESAEIIRSRNGVQVGERLELNAADLRGALGGAGGLASGRDGFGEDKRGIVVTNVQPSAQETLLDVASVGTGLVTAGYHSIVRDLVQRKQFLISTYDRVGANTALTPVNFGPWYEDSIATSVVASRAGDAVVAGGADPATILNGGREQFALVRTTAAGALVPTFGNSGRVITSFGACAARAQDVEELSVQLDSREIVIAIGSACSPNRIALAAYDSSGAAWAPFTGLSNAGPGTVLFRPRLELNQAFIVNGGAVDDDTDKLYVVGGIGNDLMVVRFDMTGAVDPTWGDLGIVRIKPKPFSEMRGYDAQVLSDGRVVVAVEGTVEGKKEMVTVMLGTTGALDAAFGSNGIVRSTFRSVPNLLTRDVEVREAQDQIFTVGSTIDGADQRFAIVSHRLNGTPNFDFGRDGQATVTYANPANAAGADIDSQGYVVMAGFTSWNLAAARIFANDGAADDPTWLSTGTRQILTWPDVWADWNNLPDRLELVARLVHPLSGDELGVWTFEVVPTPWVDGKEFLFPAKKKDLEEGVHWFVGQGHEHDTNHRNARSYNSVLDRFEHSQRYAYDVSAVRWTGSAWTTIVDGTDGSRNQDRLTWGKPVHPMTAGEIVWCTNGVQQNSAPGARDGATQCPAPNVDTDSDGVLDGCFYSDGGNTVTIRHFDGTYAFYGHMQQLSADVCPHALGSLPVEPQAVDTGTTLGLAGNSGRSGGPHIHIDHSDRGPDLLYKDAWPLQWTNVVGFDRALGPSEFPTLTAENQAQRSGSVLDFWVSDVPAPDACKVVNGTDEQDEASHPDGNFDIGFFCPDNDGEEVCLEESDNGARVGRCVSCDGDPFKPEGCLCTTDDQCAEGLSCWGRDVGPNAGEFGTATGRCYSATDGPPSWQCPYVCEELLGDNAWCFNNHPLGQAMCFDQLTSSLVATQCFDDAVPPIERTDPGPWANEGACDIECLSDQDCADRGYPAAYRCQNVVGLQFCLHESTFP